MMFHWWHVALVMIPMLPTLWSIIHIWGHEFPHASATGTVARAGGFFAGYRRYHLYFHRA